VIPGFANCHFQVADITDGRALMSGRGSDEYAHVTIVVHDILA
jgi:hypothetical protein